MRLLIFSTLFLSLISFAADLQVDLKSPRGAAIKLDVYNPGLSSALLIAPGQGCNPRLDMYDAIGSQAQLKNFTLVRLYWAYCVADPAKGQPSEDLSIEKEDLMTALKYVREVLGFSDSKLYIGGKSLGSFVSYDVFQVEKALRGLVLLTPVCTDTQTDPKNPKNAFTENYPNLASESRMVLLAQGNEDQICHNVHFQEFLKNKESNFIPLVVKGNHSFGINKPDGTPDLDYSAKNLNVISSWIFTWLQSM